MDADQAAEATSAGTRALSERVATLTGAQSPAGRVEWLPVAAISFTQLNPRDTDPAEMDALARSMGTPQLMTLAQYPAVEEFSPGAYRIVYGARRVAAAAHVGWSHIPCLIYPQLDPLFAHQLRLLENLHRVPLDPLQEASALQVTRLMANADALGLGEQARVILGVEEPLAAKVRPLLALLKDAGWSENRPAVTWQEVLDRLGLDLEPSARRRRLRILNLDPDLQAPLQELGLTESAVRALGAMQPQQQQVLVEEIRQDPALARKVRRISRVVRDKKYSLDEALDEAQPSRRHNSRQQAAQSDGASSVAVERGDWAEDQDAEVPSFLMEGERFSALNSDHAGVHAGSTQVSTRTQEAVTELLELANRLSSVLFTLRSSSNAPVSNLPAPWGDYGQTALQLIRATLVENGV